MEVLVELLGRTSCDGVVLARRSEIRSTAEKSL